MRGGPRARWRRLRAERGRFRTQRHHPHGERADASSARSRVGSMTTDGGRIFDGSGTGSGAQPPDRARSRDGVVGPGRHRPPGGAVCAPGFSGLNRPGATWAVAGGALRRGRPGAGRAAQHGAVHPGSAGCPPGARWPAGRPRFGPQRSRDGARRAVRRGQRDGGWRGGSRVDATRARSSASPWPASSRRPASPRSVVKRRVGAWSPWLAWPPPSSCSSSSIASASPPGGLTTSCWPSWPRPWCRWPPRCVGPFGGVHRVEVKDQIERVISTFTQSNPLGHFLTIVALILVAYVLVRTGRPRVLARALVPVGLTLALTYTRLAWGAAVMGLLVMLCAAGRHWLVPALLVVLLVAAALTPDVGHRIDQLTSPNTPSRARSPGSGGASASGPTWPGWPTPTRSPA